MTAVSRTIESLRILIISIATLMAFPPHAHCQLRMPPVHHAFEMSANQVIDPETGIMLQIDASIDYRKLVFFRKTDFYEARYRVYMDLKDKDGDRVRGEVWEEEVTVESYDDTRSSVRKSIVKRKYPIEPGEYRVKIIVEVLGTSRKFERESRIKVVGKGNNTLEIAAPSFYLPGRTRSAELPPPGELIVSICEKGSDEGFMPLSGGVFFEFDSWLRASCGVIAAFDDWQGGSCRLSARVVDSRGRIVAYNRQKLALDAGGNSSVCININVDHMEVGFYELSLSAEIPGTDARSTESGKFVILLNKGLLHEHFDSLLKLLSIVAEDNELADLKAALEDQRLAEWNSFWKKRDPTKNSNLNEDLSEFLSRVKYALRAFSKNKPGWETDMGKVYIKNGRPDKIQDGSGGPYSLGSYYQLWYYYSKGIVYIFQSPTGSGDYYLVDTRIL